MYSDKIKFSSQVPDLALFGEPEMLSAFTKDARLHLQKARSSLFVLATVPGDKEAIENIFKTFHTIRGLSDFLQLHDITCLSDDAQRLLDMIRKDMLPMDEGIYDVLSEAMEKLLKLLDLLEEQLSNKGQLKSPYLDIAPMIEKISRLRDNAPQPTMSSYASERMPTIDFEPDLTTCSEIENKLKDAGNQVSVESGPLKKLVSDFHEMTRLLRGAQGKLQERDRELVKARDMSTKLTQEAQREASLKSEYLASMSHEIRTLINAILGFADLLREANLNNKQKEHLNTIILSGRMLLEIVNNILDFSKVESGKLKLEQIDFNLDHIIEDVFKIIRPRLQGKPVVLYFDVDDSVPRHLIGDPTRLKQIFINLLDNAIKFTEKGEVGLTVMLEKGQKIFSGQYSINFSVTDSGIGIPENKLSQVFESFTQVDESTTRKYGGSGLGLTLCKTFIETMGGQIWVESEMGKGSKFIFTIKLPEGKSGLHRREKKGPDEFAGRAAMVVDGHPSSIKSLPAVCKKFGISVLPITRSAKQASEALLLMASEKKPLPDVIFIDTLLPEKEGFMLAYKIRQQEGFEEINLVAVAADVKLDTSEDFARAGFNILLARPIIESEFVDNLRHLLSDSPTETRVIKRDTLQKISCEGIRILVVEDSMPNQELMRVHLEDLGCIVDIASNGQEAVDMLRKKEYDICFMDLQMPVMGGMQAAQTIRTELKSKIPIIALTAAEIEEERQKCIDHGMNDYLRKPFEVDELKEKIVKCSKM